MSTTRLSRRTLMSFATAVWLTLGLAQCAQTWVRYRAIARPWNLSDALIINMPWWLSWALLTPLIAWLADRYPLSDGRAWRSLAALTAAGVVIVAAQLPATATVYWLTTVRYQVPFTSLETTIQIWYGSFFVESIVTFAGTAGAIMSIDYARGMRDEALARARAEAQATQLEASVVKARLEALAMELNPHFLFNTLSTVSGLVAQDRAPEAREVIRRLGDLLRRSLSNGHGPVSPVRQEVEFLEDYLYVQRARYADRLHVGFDIAPDARECAIPTMLLQPLVENAIKHGMEPRESACHVRVEIRRVNGSLRAVVSDSGAGFALGADGLPAHVGIGIANVRARLQHMYGDKASLTVRNKPSGGAEVVVELPASTNGVHA